MSENRAPRTSPGNVYFPIPAEDEKALEAKRLLSDEIRALIEQVVALDGTRAGASAIDAARAHVEAARAAVGALPVTQDRHDYAGNAEASLVERGPLAGRSNPVAAPLHLRMDGDVTTGWAVYGIAYEGGVGDMHGGIVAAAFDDVLGCAQMVAPVSGRTGTLTVRFRSPSPIGKRIDYVGGVDRVEGRKVFCKGTASHNGVLLAEAEAVFIAARPA